MESTHNLKLIEGEFIPNEANDILCDLISSKIRHHSLKILSIQENNEGDVSHSEKRIEDLKSVNHSLKKIINYANREGLLLSIESSIHIELVEEKVKATSK